LFFVFLHLTFVTKITENSRKISVLEVTEIAIINHIKGNPAIREPVGSRANTAILEEFRTIAVSKFPSLRNEMNCGLLTTDTLNNISVRGELFEL
jgi:hypothetical protein